MLTEQLFRKGAEKGAKMTQERQENNARVQSGFLCFRGSSVPSVVLGLRNLRFLPAEDE